MTAAGPIRVALLIDTLHPAGAEKQLVTVATGLDRRRFAPRVLCLTDGGAYEDALRAAGVPVTLIGKRHKLGGLALRRLRALLRRERPHVLHTWMFTCNLYGRLAALGLPIATLASEVAADVTKSAVRLAVDRLLAPATDAFYVNSTLVARFYHERCGIPLDEAGGHPQRRARARDGARAAGGPGRPRRRLRGVLRRPAVPGEGLRPGHRRLGTPPLRARNVALVIAGDGPSREELATLASQRGLAARVHLLGHRPDLPGVLQAADAFVLSSVHEGMSNVLMEAMALGLPCVTTPVGGVEELVAQGEAGLVVEASAPEPIAAALGQLLDDPALARRLGDAARKRMASEFSIEANVRRFEALYEALATRGHAG